MAANKPNKTVPTDDSVQSYLDSIEPEQKRQDAIAILEIMREATKLEPVMWGKIVGFGKYHYKYASGREGDGCRIGVSSNKNAISLYICAADENGYIAERYKATLPKANIGRSCVRFKRLDDLDPATLKKLIREGARATA